MDPSYWEMTDIGIFKLKEIQREISKIGEEIYSNILVKDNMGKYQYINNRTIKSIQAYINSPFYEKSILNPTNVTEIYPEDGENFILF